MTEPKRYETREALAVIALLPGDDEGAIRYAMATQTDIPAERIDFAASEMRELLPAVRAMAVLAELHLGRAPTTAEMLAMMPSCIWIDDDKGNIDVNTRFMGEEGEELATAKVHRNYKTGATRAEFTKG